MRAFILRRVGLLESDLLCSAGSTKRVASAVGEGAAVVAQIHSILGAAATSA